MGILNFTTPQENNSRAQGNGAFGRQGNNDRPKAKLWLNVGYDVNGKFIPLPGGGTAIDTTDFLPVSGQNEDYVKQRTAQNQLLKMLQDLGATFEPGQEEEIALTVRLRKVNDELRIEENEYAFDFNKLVRPKTPAGIVAAE